MHCSDLHGDLQRTYMWLVITDHSVRVNTRFCSMPDKAVPGSLDFGNHFQIYDPCGLGLIRDRFLYKVERCNNKMFQLGHLINNTFVLNWFPFRSLTWTSLQPLSLKAHFLVILTTPPFLFWRAILFRSNEIRPFSPENKFDYCDWNSTIDSPGIYRLTHPSLSWV